MAHYSLTWSDNLHTTAFTPRDYQVELLASAREDNIIVCLSHESSKEFIALKLLQEFAHQIRRNGSHKCSLYLAEDGDSAYNLIHYLTDLKVFNANQTNAQSPDVKKIINENDVIILSPGILYPALIDGYLCLSDVNLIIIEKCHENNTEFHNLIEIFQEFYNGCQKKPKILGFAGPIHSADCEPEYIQDRVKFLETLIDSRTETASDIVTVLRYCTKPVEYIVECAPPSRTELTNFLQELVLTRVAFINEHRYDPSEIYSDEFMEELIAIPDPKKEPLDFLKNFLMILSEMGPWCADRAALNLLMQIEKQKVKTPYERHFLLLCLISTTFVQVRSYCEFVFQKSGSEKENVEKYSTPKVLRLLETLRLFKPEESKTMQKPAIENSSLKSFAEEVDSLDFQILQINIENTIKTIESENSNSDHNLAQLEAIVNGIKESDSTLQEPQVAEKTPTESGSPKIEIADSVSTTTSKYGAGIRHRHKRKYNTGGPRNKHNYHNDWSNDPDALCGIIFCNHKNTAKILFSLLQEMSRHDPELKFLNVQYTVDRVADPLTEPKEAELEHRKQEEVLKRFRMHECNILIGTSVLEEGIDLPKCNLVIRWDQPITYRSYVQCKGRARAPQAYHVILVAPDLGINMDNTDDRLSDKSHKFICQLQSTPPKDDEEQNSKSDSLPEEVTSGTSESLNDSVDENSTCSAKESDSGTGKVNGISDNKYENLVEIESLDELLANLNVNQKTKSPAKTTKGEKKEIEGKRTEIIGCVLANKKEEFAWSQSEPKYAVERMQSTTDSMVTQLAEYYAIESMLLSKCANTEPADDEHREADRFSNCIQPYKPLMESNSLVTLDTSISLINKYCAKLPSDTFTKLTPIWRCAKTTRNAKELYQYTIRLPINSPLKRDIQGLPMPTKMLARRMAAFIACKELHQHRELDDNLQPIGKEGFKATESDWEDFELEKIDEQIVNENIEPRPGTTKRRQYYYKRIASAFSDCRPSVESKSYLYHIKMTLECPIPEEQNTRGRRIYPPEEAAQGFGILTLKKIPKVSAFPIFTRSGEVRVALELSSDDIELTESQVERINTFLNYTFTNVLRLQKFLMLFDPEATENCFFIVPTVKTDNGIAVDWDFLELIYQKSEKMPRAVSDEDRSNKEFDANQFKDAVVMPWYRNQDQPQYFYVAEICNHLSPMSSFPGENYSTFQEYYFRKYEITIQNTKQPLLDVDHTSARLNFLTPRYVNRKGVALPTSSEETKRAKRENLEQKQILVPELCTIHPFPASLWRAAVCLPCILYRINALLLADEIRKQVSYDLGLGQMEIEEQNFEWPTLDFGWSLAEVLKKSREAKITEGENVVTTKENGIKAVDSKEQEKPNEPVENGHNSDEDAANGDKSGQLAKGKSDEKTVNDLLEEVDEKLKSESFLEIGTWSNDMAENIPMGNEDISDDEWGLLPPNVNMCSRNKTNIRYGSPTSWEVSSSAQNPLENYYEDSDVSYQSEDDYDAMSIDSGENQTGPLRIEFKSNNTAEAIETEEEIQKREKQLAIINDKNVKDKNYQLTRNLASGFNFISDKLANPNEIKIKDEFNEVRHFIKEHIQQSGMLVLCDMDIKLAKKENKKIDLVITDLATYIQIFPYIEKSELQSYLTARGHDVNGTEIKLTLDDYYEMNRMYLNRTQTDELYTVEGSGDLFDNFNDSQSVIVEEKRKYLKLKYESLMEKQSKEVSVRDTEFKNLQPATKVLDIEFSFDHQPNLSGHPGPSPSIILQALTMSNANDGINLERLETIGDSFLKYAITTYLYITYENVHEGKLSHLRSKQVSNLNLYRLGRRKVLGECMIATKFEPHDNWLPPCYYVPKELEKALIEARIPACHWNLADLPNIKQLSSEEICKLVRKKAETLGLLDDDEMAEVIPPQSNVEGNEDFPCFIPYNLVTQHSIPDKSVADCVEALIGAYLIECGPRGALLFMAWLGIRVLPTIKIKDNHGEKFRIPGSTQPNEANKIIAYGEWSPPKSPLLTFAPNPYETLEVLLDGFSAFENAINYHFKDRSYLLQAMTHASYSPNRLTDCYQRLEFLGDAVLDYLITRHLYEDPRQHSPGALTDLRSALVNNTIFASLAVRHGFHKYFRHLSPALNEVIERFVRIQHENGHSISEEYYLLSEEECDEAEDVEVPKALGDVFESVAGAIFLDSNMSLDTVWKVYSTMMRPEIEQFSNSVPKSPIRELLELEPETAKFSKPEKLADGRRVRVTVEVFGKGTFRGIGRNYRIAKCTAAKCALRQLKKQGLISKKH